MKSYCENIEAFYSDAIFFTRLKDLVNVRCRPKEVIELLFKFIEYV
jgi:hypothetical protein